MIRLLAIASALVATPTCLGFAPMHGRALTSSRLTHTVSSSVRVAASPLEALDFVTNSGSSMDASAVTNVMANALYSDVAAGMTSSSVFLSETEAWVQPLSLVLGPFLNFFSFAMVSETFLSNNYIIVPENLFSSRHTCSFRAHIISCSDCSPKL